MTGRQKRLIRSAASRTEPATVGYFEATWDGRAWSRRWVGLTQRSGKLHPVLVVCDHETTDRFLCGNCTRDFAAVLADIPALLAELELAQVRDVRHVEHGTVPGSLPDPDATSIPWDERATKAWVRIAGDLLAVAVGLGFEPAPAATLARRISEALPRLARFETAQEWAGRISRAVAYAHRVIDSPPSPWFYGPCPTCNRDLYGERLDDDDPEAKVVCPWPECTYAAPLADHRRAQIDAGDNRRLTVAELVGAITAAGEVVSRDQINGWIRRDGLPREREIRPKLVRGRLVAEEVWVYRLGDVRAKALEAEIRRQPQPT